MENCPYIFSALSSMCLLPNLISEAINGKHLANKMQIKYAYAIILRNTEYWFNNDSQKPIYWYEEDNYAGEVNHGHFRKGKD